MLVTVILILCDFLNLLRPVAVIGDSQANWWVARAAVADMRERNVDFAVHLGDVSYCASRRKWREVRAMFGELGRPVKWTIGNHEILGCGGRTKLRYKRTWVRFWQPEVGDTVQSYKVRNRWTFIHLDSSNKRTERRHVKWLARVLQRSEKVIIFSHRGPPHPPRLRWRLDPLGRWGANRRLWRLLTSARHKIQLFLHGHHHGLLRYEMDGLQVLCSGGGGGSLANKSEYYHYLLLRLGYGVGVEVVPIKRRKGVR